MSLRRRRLVLPRTEGRPAPGRRHRALRDNGAAGGRRWPASNQWPRQPPRWAQSEWPRASARGGRARLAPVAIRAGRPRAL